MADIKTYFTNIESYHRIVACHYKDYLNMIEDYNNYSNGKDFSDVDEETQNRLYAVQRSMDETAMVIIAFSQMTMESFCNTYLRMSYSKKDLSGWNFERRLNKTISLLLASSGISIAEKDLPNYYGDGVSELLKKRNKIVHRYPVIVEFPLSKTLTPKNIKKFENVAKAGAEEIQKQVLRRIDRTLVKKISEAYPTFIKTLTDAGCTFENIPFMYKV